MLNFERHKWGGVRHPCPEYIAFDLERFAGLDKVTPTKEDLHIMRQIIKLIEECEATTKPNDLEKRLATILKSNKDEKRILIQILAYCGILYPNKHSFLIRAQIYEIYCNLFSNAIRFSFGCSRRS